MGKISKNKFVLENIHELVNLICMKVNFVKYLIGCDDYRILQLRDTEDR